MKCVLKLFVNILYYRSFEDTEWKETVPFTTSVEKVIIFCRQFVKLYYIMIITMTANHLYQYPVIISF